MTICKSSNHQSRASILMLPLFLFQYSAFAMEPVPEISVAGVRPGMLDMSFSNISTGGTYYVEWEESLVSSEWMDVYSFEGNSGITNWSHAFAGSPTSAFYRLVRDPYHLKVGQSASLDVPGFHDVSGTAHIVNNRTVELRNFNFDGGGIVIEVWVSPNASFSPHVSLSEDLYGTAYTNETVVLDIPEGSDLDDFKYISIWCVEAGVSFGDGPFQ